MNEQFRLATFDQAGSLVAESTPVSDPNGNRIHDGEKKLVFDAFDRLLRVEEVGGSTVATYRYDVAGRRTQKTTSSEDTYYVSDGAREIEEVAANGAVQADYVFGGYVDHVVQARRGGGEYYLHADSTFSVAAVTNAAGAVVTRYAYGSIYGTSSISAGSDVGNPWRFQGRRWDAESGFYQFRARYLDPALGRFVSRDPLGLWGDASNVGNGYTFCGNDPVNCVDPFGLKVEMSHSNLQAMARIFGFENLTATWTGPAKNTYLVGFKDPCAANKHSIAFVERTGGSMAFRQRLWAAIEGTGVFSLSRIQAVAARGRTPRRSRPPVRPDPARASGLPRGFVIVDPAEATGAANLNGTIVPIAPYELTSAGARAWAFNRILSPEGLAFLALAIPGPADDAAAASLATRARRVPGGGARAAVRPPPSGRKLDVGGGRGPAISPAVSVRRSA